MINEMNALDQNKHRRLFIFHLERRLSDAGRFMLLKLSQMVKMTALKQDWFPKGTHKYTVLIMVIIFFYDQNYHCQTFLYQGQNCIMECTQATMSKELSNHQCYRYRITENIGEPKNPL